MVANSVFSTLLTSVTLILVSVVLFKEIVYFLFTADACTLYVLLIYCLSFASTDQVVCSGLIVYVAAIFVAVEFLAFVIILFIAWTVLLFESISLWVVNLLMS